MNKSEGGARRCITCGLRFDDENECMRTLVRSNPSLDPLAADEIRHNWENYRYLAERQADILRNMASQWDWYVRDWIPWTPSTRCDDCEHAIAEGARHWWTPDRTQLCAECAVKYWYEKAKQMGFGEQAGGSFLTGGSSDEK